MILKNFKKKNEYFQFKIGPNLTKIFYDEEILLFLTKEYELSNIYDKKNFNIQIFYLQEKDMLEGPILKCLQVYQEKIYRIKKEIKYKLYIVKMILIFLMKNYIIKIEVN